MSASDTLPRFALNPEAGLAVHHVGNEREAVIVVDRAMTNAQALVDYAASQTSFAPVGDGGYPGVRAPAPLDYVEALVRRLDPVIRSVFGVHDALLAKAECSFSIVTTPAIDLQPIQRVPHIDTTYPLQFAVLQYLCDGPFGGTGFFRHAATGFETIDAERDVRYQAVSAAERETTPPPMGYLGKSPPNYLMTTAFEAMFDRVLVYRSCLLHCGLIPPDMPLTTDPRRGRLTANIFVNYVQK